MKKIKNIIFDLGNVLFPLNGYETLNRFKTHGLQQVNESYRKLAESEMFLHFEIGKISPEEFIEGFNKMFGLNLDHQTFCDCWNAMLIGYPKENNPFLENLKSQGYNLYVLSNTNAIHTDYLEPMAGWRPGLFSKIYYSQQIHLRKPDRECFEWVISDAKINASETLFIDDRAENIQGAKSCGIQTLHLTDIKDLYNRVEEFLR